MNRNARHMVAFIALVLAAIVGLVTLPAAQAITGGDHELLTVSSSGEPGNGSSFYVHTSHDASIIAFESWTTNWADPGYANRWTDIFIKERSTGEMRQITKSYGDGATDEDSFDPVLSADGRYVAFFSYATNLVPGDTNRDEWSRNGLDLFIYDAQLDSMERASVTAGGEQIDGNSVGTITPDGKVALIISDGDGILPGDPNPDRRSAIYWREWQTGQMERITFGLDGGFPDGKFVHVWGSYDGRLVVFSSDSSNLVPGDTNGALDIFLYDRATGQVRRVSVAAGGAQGNDVSGQPQITADGRYVVFRSHASNLVPGDTNGEADIFRYHVETGHIERVSLGVGGVQGNGQSRDVSICGTGRLVSFTSEADNLVAGDTNGLADVFLVDTETGEIELVSHGMNGEPANGRAHRSFLAPDCGLIAFATDAGNLVPDDLNGERDIFADRISLSLPEPLRAVLMVAPVVAAGDELPVSLLLANDGARPLTLDASYALPAGTSYVPGSATGGATHAAGVISWQGELLPGQSVVLSFAIAVPSAPAAPYPLAHHVAILGDWTASLTATTIVNGLTVYLPAVHNRD